ncbi:TPA: hypothetical protein CPT94_08860 [Candidatus Gastranaerophilales bacterium HUM_22]|nr:MAG TPA: hypothetical protein CPT94_08860 [Candidatus Gastranaerophilales bacterium HUM_22]
MIKAFTYMFKDNRFIQKSSIYFLFLLIGTFCTNYANILLKAGGKPVLHLVYLAGIILLLVPYGYVVSCIKALTEQKENFILPMFNVKTNFVIGLKYIIAILLLSLIFGFITVAAAFMIGLICGILKAKVLAIVLLSLVITSAVLLLIFYTLALNWIFANTQAITSFLQFKRAHALISQDYPRYWKGVGLAFGLNFVLGILLIFVLGLAGKNIVSIFFATLMSTFLTSYIVFVNAMINAKSISPDCRI